MINRKNIVILTIMLLANISHANETKHLIDVKLDECLTKKENMNMAGMTSCTVVAARAWDNELNSTYKALVGKLSTDGKERLKTSQLAWIKYRDLEYKNIEAVYSNLEGTMYIPMRAMSDLQITKNRVLELNTYLSLYAI